LGEYRGTDGPLIGELGSDVDASHRSRDHIITIATLSREQSVDTGPIPEILDRLGDRFEEAAELLEDEERDPAAEALPEELREELDDLDSHLSTLTRRRRAEIKSGIGRDEFTP